ncbi:5'-methylthioadenosine/S-adenosylhomocysteine nucleosidase [Microvirga zambiensis]|uniref:5'-methylthioadenosine/S-adenosylhomocysteine nucleosidase n=1 Tax=Microvirga zambiensis TaxID=1402137 RepID=UPI00191F96BD|nr:5'-methylthioadenosine/S-adenosylhomocysteine nucleosidase [Microvirga zambiensis]
MLECEKLRLSGPDDRDCFDDHRHSLRHTRGVRRSPPPVRVCPGVDHTGRVPVLARARARADSIHRFTTFGCEDLIFAGVAGALTDLEVGSVVLVTRGATHDYGLLSNGVFTCVPVGDLPLPGIVQPLQDLPRVPAQVEQTFVRLRERMADKLTIHLGAVLSGDVFINCQDARTRLRDLGGDIVDMESTAVLDVARRFGKEAYIVRTVSDGAGDDSHLSYSEMVSIVAHNSAICVEDLLKIMH